MGLKLENLPPRLRDRIMLQLAREGAAPAADRREADAGVPLQATQRQEQPPPLVGGKKGKRTRKASCGRRYRVEFTIYSTQPMDWDNASGAVKELQDHMVRAGWLPDGDGWSELEGVARGEKVAHRSEERTECIITRIK